MNIVVTGGAGFIGSHVCDALRLAGHNILVIDNLSTGKTENMNFLDDNMALFWSGDICDKEVHRLFKNFAPDAVIHLAAQAAISTSIEDPARDLEINGMGTLNILQAAMEYGAQRFVFSSTSAVYKHINYERPGEFSDSPTRENTVTGPDTPYGISKLAAEGYVRMMFPDSCILRFGNVIGERQVPIGENQVLSRMIRHFKYGDMFYIHGSGRQRRDFVHVSDVVSAITAALRELPGTYNIATGESHSVNDIAAIIERLYDARGYAWEHTETEDPRSHICLDVQSAKDGLGWAPKVGIEEAVKRTVGWWEENGVK